MYFGAAWTASKMTISGNTFKKCASQQGGAVFLKNMTKVDFTGVNNFEENQANMYSEKNKFTPTSG